MNKRSFMKLLAGCVPGIALLSVTPKIREPRALDETELHDLIRAVKAAAIEQDRLRIALISDDACKIIAEHYAQEHGIEPMAFPVGCRELTDEEWFELTGIRESVI